MLNAFLSAHLWNITFSAKSPCDANRHRKSPIFDKNHVSPAANKRRHEAFFKFYITL